jgi:hypothetical protein
MAESANSRDAELAASAAENATARNENLANATKATTGQAGLEEGNRAKANLQKRGPRF